MRVLIASGGSGGHIFPAVALASALKGRDHDIDIKFIGSDKTLDRRIFEKEGHSFSLLSSNKLPYGPGLGIFIFFIKLLLDAVKSFFIIMSYKPDIVVGFGGYVAAPVIFAARILGIPEIVHEQNVVPGRANKFVFGMADKIAISFEETRGHLGRYAKKAVYTGNPIRAALFSDSRGKNYKQDGKEHLGLDGKKITILVIGGSQGAHRLNEAFINALSGLDKNTRMSFQVMHITGIKDYEWVATRYKELGLEHRVWSFIDRIEELYIASDLVVTRSGASAIFEAAFFGKPMVLVPYPFAMSHQAENARVFSKKGAAVEIDEKDLSPEVFRGSILNLLNDKDAFLKMAEASHRLSVPEASDNLAGLVLNSAERS